MSMRIGGKAPGPTAEINVTPMADIMIVLLIIFMVTAPLIAKSGVTLPAARNSRDARAHPIVVLLTLDGAIAIEGSTVRDADGVSSEVRARLQGVAAGGRLVHLKADTALPYAEVRSVMEILRESGADEVALITSPRAGS